jgi:prefoldin subunit 5
MENEKFKGTQRDLLVEVAKDIGYLKEQLKDLSCQTMAKLNDHDRRLDTTEKCLETLKEMLKGKQDLLRIIITIGTVALIALIYHMTGYKI